MANKTNTKQNTTNNGASAPTVKPLTPEVMKMETLMAHASECGLSKADVNRYNALNSVIETTQVKADGYARTIAGALSEVFKKGLWKLEYKNFESYCIKRHDIAKSTASEAISTFDRFKKVDKYEIEDKYSNTPWRSLISMRKLEDVEIERLKLLDCKSSTEVKARVKAYGIVKDKLAPNWTNEDFETIWLQHVEDERNKADVKMIEDAEKKDKEEKAKEGFEKVSEENAGDVPFEKTSDNKEDLAPEELVFNLSKYAGNWEAGMTALVDYLAENKDAILSSKAIIVIQN